MSREEKALLGILVIFVGLYVRASSPVLMILTAVTAVSALYLFIRAGN